MEGVDERLAHLTQLLGVHPDFPKPGITFLDMFPIMKDAAQFDSLIQLLVDHVKTAHPDVEMIFGLDARGFIIGPLMAQKLGIGFAPIRKAGKLPGETIQASYKLEYGEDKFEVQKHSLDKPGQKVIIVDDLLATGGTMSAAYQLLTDLKANILECIVIIELVALGGHKKIPCDIFSLIKSNYD